MDALKSLDAQERILKILEALEKDKEIDVEFVMREYGVCKTTVQRDIAKIRNILEYDIKTIKEGGGKYQFVGKKDVFSIGEAFAFMILLLSSRSYSKEELSRLKNRMIEPFTEANKIRFEKFFRSYLRHYKEAASTGILKRISQLIEAIIDQKIVTFSYITSEKTSRRKVEPITITLNRGSFFLVGNDVELHGERRHFRIDRLINLRTTAESYSIPMGTEFLEVGKYVNSSFNMFSGDRELVRLRITKGTLEYLKKESPSVTVIQEETNHFIVELEVLGLNGIMFWLLSQEDRVEVLSPPALRQKMKDAIQRMNQLYQKELS